ncbi:MAG TPA: hypothetical protein VN649_15185 [Ramlibacter sp.]|nr:hypothetical protein [Ramlibacter sp.]
MPITLSTQAANADILGDDDGSPLGMPHEIGADGTPRDRSDRAVARQSKAAESNPGEAKPGKDISAAKDKDADKP